MTSTAAPDVGADAKAERRIADVGRGRTLLIDFYVARCCTSVLVGDLETRWLEGDPPDGVEQVGLVAGSRIVADHRLVGVLTAGGARIVESGGLFGRSLGVRLAAPELWLAFLETPAARRIRGHTRRPLRESAGPMS
ncbi:MAG: hypothetical protein V4515_11280 [Chloroflexota bacterium]